MRDADTSARHREAIAKTAEITSHIGMANTELVRGVGPRPLSPHHGPGASCEATIWKCPTAKESKFADEPEVRGIIMNVKANFDPYRKTYDLPRPAPKTWFGISRSIRDTHRAFRCYDPRASSNASNECCRCEAGRRVLSSARLQSTRSCGAPVQGR
jgi:hypothetical protein